MVYFAYVCVYVYLSLCACVCVYICVSLKIIMQYVFAIQEGQEFTLGRTENLLKHIKEDLNGSMAKRLVYFSIFKDMQQALAAEKALMEMTWEEKYKLFKYWQVKCGILAGGPSLANVRNYWSIVGPIIA